MPKDRDTVMATLREAAQRSRAEYVTILREDLLLILGLDPEPQSKPTLEPEQASPSFNPPAETDP